MKKKIAIFMMIVITTVLLGKFSLGLSVGLPGKITALYQFNEKVGVDFSTTAFFGFGFLLVNANTDLLFFSSEILKNDTLHLNGYWGVGAGITIPGSFDELLLSVRVPFGVQMPVEFNGGQVCEAFLEMVPLVVAIPVPAVTFTTSVGARYVF